MVLVYVAPARQPDRPPNKIKAGGSPQQISQAQGDADPTMPE
jgi:hypothetical protein